MRHLRWRSFAGPAVILLAALVAVAPQLLRGNTCGHDFDFHLVSWFDALGSWHQGTLYPHWTRSANYGAGEPRFVFYPPLTWMAGAALGALLPWALAPIALTFLLLAGTGLATRALARQALDEAPATLAGCAAIFSGYALFCAYERSAFGELAGGFWIPLALLLMLREGPSGKWWLDAQALLLALVVAGAWLSNAPVGVMLCYLLAAVAVGLAVPARSCAPLLRACVGVALGLGLAGAYLVPAAWEQRWVDIRQATSDPGERIENSFLFAHHGDPSLALHDAELQRVSVIAAVMLGIAFGGLLLAWMRGRLGGWSQFPARRWWLISGLIPVAILVLQLPVSLPVWNLLPRLRFLQFPWRWLVALEAPMGIFLAAAVWPGPLARRWTRIAAGTGCAGAFLAATAMAGVLFFQVCDDEDAVAPMTAVYRSGAGFVGTDEYAPLGADDTVVATGLPAGCLVSDPARTLGLRGGDDPDANPAWNADQHSCAAVLAARGKPDHLRMAGQMPGAGWLVLRLRSFPAWRVTVNGQPAAFAPAREDGLMAVAVPQGRVELAADWATTPDVLGGRWLSGLAALLLVGLWWLGRRSARADL